MVILIRDNYTYESEAKIPYPSYLCSQRETLEKKKKKKTILLGFRFTLMR